MFSKSFFFIFFVAKWLNYIFYLISYGLTLVSIEGSILYMLTKWLLAKDQISVLISKDFKLKYNSTALGFFWSFGVPIAQSLVYFFAFSVIMRFKVDNYLLYMLSGMFIWNFFCSSVIMSTNTFLSNSELMKKTSFPRHFLVVGAISSELVHFVLTIPILVVLMMFGGVMPSWSCFTIPIVLLNLIMFTLGCSFFMASINMFSVIWNALSRYWFN